MSSSNHREHADYNEQPQLIRCRECKSMGIRYAHGEFCSERCFLAHHKRVQAFHAETLRIRNREAQ